MPHFLFKLFITLHTTLLLSTGSQHTIDLKVIRIEMELAPLHEYQLQKNTCAATLSYLTFLSTLLLCIVSYLGTPNIYPDPLDFINTEQQDCFCPHNLLSMGRLQTTDIADGQGHHMRRKYQLCQGTSEIHLTHCLVPGSGHLGVPGENLRTSYSNALPEFSTRLY